MANGKKSKVRIDDLMGNGHQDSPKVSIPSAVSDDGNYEFNDKINKNYFLGMYMHFRQNLGRYAAGIGVAAAIAAFYLGPMGGYDKVKSKVAKIYEGQISTLETKVKENDKSLKAKDRALNEEKKKREKMEAEFAKQKEELIRKAGTSGAQLRFGGEYGEIIENIHYDFIDNRTAAKDNRVDGSDYVLIQVKTKDTGKRIKGDEQNPARRYIVEGYADAVSQVFNGSNNGNLKYERKAIMEGTYDSLTIEGSANSCNITEKPKNSSSRKYQIDCSFVNALMEAVDKAREEK